eukprot:3029074-Rhodomonas_salina.1
MKNYAAIVQGKLRWVLVLRGNGLMTVGFQAAKAANPDAVELNIEKGMQWAKRERFSQIQVSSPTVGVPLLFSISSASKNLHNKASAYSMNFGQSPTIFTLRPDRRKTSGSCWI